MPKYTINTCYLIYLLEGLASHPLEEILYKWDMDEGNLSIREIISG